MMEQASGTISLTLVTRTGRCPLALPASDERLDEVRSFLGVEDFAEAVIGDIHFSLPHLADIIPLIPSRWRTPTHWRCASRRWNRRSF